MLAASKVNAKMREKVKEYKWDLLESLLIQGKKVEEDDNFFEEDSSKEG